MLPTSATVILTASLASPGLLSGLSRTIATHPLSILLIIIGLAGVGLGTLGIVQTRRWPQGEPIATKADAMDPRPARDPPTPTSDTPPAPALPAEDPESPVQIRLPQIQKRHPEVWTHDEPFQVRVRIDRKAMEEPAICTLVLLQDNRESEVGSVPVNQTEEIPYTIDTARKGEAHLVARLSANGRPTHQNARLVRFVDYRTEIVETFEDFEKWAQTHYTFPRRTLTAREFVDRYADMVPGTPVAPLDKIVDIYEWANFSEHRVDRNLYLELVDAFLELEDAGALEGPARNDPGGT